MLRFTWRPTLSINQSMPYFLDVSRTTKSFGSSRNVVGCWPSPYWRKILLCRLKHTKWLYKIFLEEFTRWLPKANHQQPLLLYRRSPTLLSLLLLPSNFTPHHRFTWTPACLLLSLVFKTVLMVSPYWSKWTKLNGEKSNQSLIWKKYELNLNNFIWIFLILVSIFTGEIESAFKPYSWHG